MALICIHLTEMPAEITALTNGRPLPAFEREAAGGQRCRAESVQGNEKERQPTPELKTNSIKSLTVQANSYKSAKTIIMTVAKAV